MIGEDINSILDIVPIIDKLAQEKAYDNVAKRTKESSFRDEPVYRCDILSFLKKIKKTIKNHPGIPFRAGLVGPIEKEDDGHQHADMIAFKLYEDGSYCFKYLPWQTNTKILLEHLDEHEDKLMFTGSLYVDKIFYNENKYIIDTIGKELFHGATIIPIYNRQEIDNTIEHYYIGSGRDVLTLWRRASEVLDDKINVKQNEYSGGLYIAKNPIQFIGYLGRGAVNRDENCWCVVEPKGERKLEELYRCCFAYVDQGGNIFWKTNVPNTRVTEILHRVEEDIAANKKDDDINKKIDGINKKIDKNAEKVKDTISEDKESSHNKRTSRDKN